MGVPIDTGPEDLIACHECDLLNRVPQVRGAHTAKCVRCGATLYQVRVNGLDRSLALTVTGLVLFGLANVFPLMTFEMSGRSQENTLMSGAFEFWRSGFPDLALLVFATSVALPLASLLSMAYVLMPVRLGIRPWQVERAFRLVRWLRPWAMIEVYMLGVFVAVVKLADFAEIVPGVALYCFASLIVITAAAAWMLDSREVWRRLEALA